jgi:hypothetical protein
MKTSINKSESELDKMKRESFEWLDRYGKTAHPFISVAINAFSQLSAVTDEDIHKASMKYCDVGGNIGLAGRLGYFVGATNMRDGLIPASGNTVKKEEIIDINFIKWYSGMDEQKIRNAFKRYKNEVLSSAPDTKIEKGKEEFKTPQWFLNRKKKRTKKYNG